MSTWDCYEQEESNWLIKPQHVASSQRWRVACDLCLVMERKVMFLLENSLAPLTKNVSMGNKMFILFFFFFLRADNLPFSFSSCNYFVLIIYILTVIRDNQPVEHNVKQYILFFYRFFFFFFLVFATPFLRMHNMVFKNSIFSISQL